MNRISEILRLNIDLYKISIEIRKAIKIREKNKEEQTREMKMIMIWRSAEKWSWL